MNEDKDAKNAEELDESAANVGPFIPAKVLLLGIYDKAERLSEMKGRVSGLATGYDDLDAITGGLQQGNLVVVAGGAGMAKSTLCQNIARQVAKRQELNVAYFSLEATNEQVIQRIMCAESSVNPLFLNSGRFTEDDWSKLATDVQVFYTLSLLMDDRLHKSVTDIWTACDELVEVSELGLVIIDSLPLVSDLAPTDIWNAAKLLKLMARHFDVPVVVATHLYSGRTDRRPDRRPLMGDLAGVESYADEVILLHRTQLPNLGESFDEVDGIEPLDVIVAKQTNGPVGLIRLGFVPQHALITDLDTMNEPTGF